jgi:hypothetical protein
MALQAGQGGGAVQGGTKDVQIEVGTDRHGDLMSLDGAQAGSSLADSKHLL